VATDPLYEHRFNVVRFAFGQAFVKFPAGHVSIQRNKVRADVVLDQVVPPIVTR